MDGGGGGVRVEGQATQKTLINIYQLSKKDYFVTYTHILVFCDLHTHFILENVCVSHKIVKTRIFLGGQTEIDTQWSVMVLIGAWQITC